MTPELFATPELATAAAPMFAKWTTLLLMWILLRDMVWRGIALWKAGSQKKLTRFICLFVFNTIGILPIIYLAFFNKRKKK